MVMTKILPLNGGMDKDSSLLNVDNSNGTILDRRNCRSRSTRGSRAGATVPMKGMQEVTSFMSAGTNEVVGYVEDKKRDGGVFLVWNSLSNHSIFRFIASSGIVEKVLFEESGLGFLNVNVDASITGDFLIWTDGIGIQKIINLERAYNYTNGIVVDWKDTYEEITEETISFAKRTPMKIPQGAQFTDLDVKTNNLQGSMFQFAYQYVYKDGDISPVGSYSELFVHPSVIAFSGTQTSSSFANAISFAILENDTEITKVRLLARDSNISPWFIAYELEKNFPTSIVSSVFIFYNDSVRKYITTEDALALNSGVPISSDTIEVVGNRAFLGGNKYDEVKPEDISITTTVERRNYNANNFIDKVFVNWDQTEDGRTTGFTIDIPVVGEGDLVSLNTDVVVTLDFDGDGGGDRDDFISYNKGAFNTEYIVKSGEDRNTVKDFLINEFNGSIRDYFFYDVVYDKSRSQNPDDIQMDWIISAISTGTGSLRVDISVNTSYGIDKLEIIKVESDNIPSIVYKTITTENQFKPTFLNNSLYSVGVKYMNDFGYTNGVIAETSVAIDDSFASTGYPWSEDTAYNTSVIRCDISGTPPSWATKYQFVYSKSLSYSAVFDFPSAIQSSKVDFEGRQVSAIEIPSDVNYQFVEGDFVNTDFLNTGTTKYFGVKIVGQVPSITVTVSDSETDKGVESKIIAGNFILLDGVSNPKLFNEIELIIYRPIGSSDDILYYENPVIHNIISGLHQDTSVVLDNGDAWIIPRSFQIIDPNDDTESARFFSNKRNIWVQDFFINKRYGLKGYSQGKPIVAVDNISTDVQSAISYGGKYFDDTEVNNLSKFYGNIKQSLSESDGAITGLELVGDVLKVIQDNKETSIYIGKQQITNADGALQLVATNNVIGAINPALEDYGTRYPQSVCKFNRNLYYFDSDRGEFIRSSPNGQISISDYGMKSYFSEKKSELLIAKSLGQTNNVKCGFDIEHGELVASFFINNIVETLTFVDEGNEWNQFVDYKQTEFGNETGAFRYGTVGDIFISFKKNSLYVHEATNNFNEFYGTIQPISITGVLNDNPTEDKHLKELSMDSTVTYDVEITTPIASTRPVGHKTILKEGSFRNRQGNYVSPILRNIRVANGSDDLSLIYGGDRVVGKYAEIKLTKTPSSDFYLYDIGVSYLIQK